MIYLNEFWYARFKHVLQCILSGMIKTHIYCNAFGHTCKRFMRGCTYHLPTSTCCHPDSILYLITCTKSEFTCMPGPVDVWVEVQMVEMCNWPIVPQNGNAPGRGGQCASTAPFPAKFRVHSLIEESSQTTHIR